MLCLNKTSRVDAKEVKMAEGGNDRYFYSPYAQVNAIDFGVVRVLEFFDTCIFRRRFII